MSQRIDIEADDVPELLDKPGVLRQLEGVDAMRLQAMRLPDALHGRGTDPSRFGHHAKRPVGRLARRISHGQIDYALDRCRGRGRLPGFRVLSRRSPSTPSRMNRSCHRQTTGLDNPERLMISVVPQPSPVARMTLARATCFRRRFPSLTMASSRRRSSDVTFTTIPALILRA